MSQADSTDEGLRFSSWLRVIDEDLDQYMGTTLFRRHARAYTRPWGDCLTYALVDKRIAWYYRLWKLLGEPDYEEGKKTKTQLGTPPDGL